MPFLHIRIAGTRLERRRIETLQREATRLMSKVMRKKPELTTVLVETHDAGSWSIGDRPVEVAAHLDMKVTQGTKTADEKAQFVRQAHDLLATVVGSGLPPATYVVIDEVPADAWGYGGSTQEARRAAGVPQLPKP